MKKTAILILAVLMSFAILYCKSEKSEMSLEDYAKIQAEINIPDPALDPQKVEKVTSKYGYSFTQYKEFNDKVEKDPDLRVKLGEIRLKNVK